MHEMRVRSLCREDPMEKEMATHASILAWEIQWTEEPWGLQSMTSQELNMTEQLTLSLHFLKLKMVSKPPFLGSYRALPKHLHKSFMHLTGKLLFHCLPSCLLSSPSWATHPNADFDKRNLKSIIALHINILWGATYRFASEEKNMNFLVYIFGFLYLSILIMYIFINILVIIVFKIQKYLKQKIPQVLELCCRENNGTG